MAISAVVAVAFGIVGYHLIGFALQMVGLFGEGMGIDARSREIYAETHKWVHLFAAACALAIGVFYHRRSRLLFSLTVAAVVFCGSYGVMNMYGFTGANRVTVAAVKDAKRAGVEREYQNARADLQRQIAGLEGWVKSAESAREKVFLAKQIDAKRREMSALKAPVPDADTVLGDTQSFSLSRLTGWSAEGWMLWMPLLLAVFVFFGESLSFVVVGHMVSGIVALFATYYAMTRKPAVAEDKDANSNTSGSGSVGGSGTNVVPLHPTEPATPALQASVQAVAEPATPAIQAAPAEQSSAVAQPATQQRDELPVATDPPFTSNVRNAVARLRASGMTWREIGSELGRDHTVLFKQFHGGKRAKRHNGSLGLMTRHNGASQHNYA